MAPPRVATPGVPVHTRNVERRLGTWLFSVAVGTNIPVPLLLIYQERLALEPSSVTALFGVYAAGLVPALFFAGPAADRWGRRRVALPATIGAGLASILFIPAMDSLELLFAVRLLQGVVSGATFSIGSAWLVETSSRAGHNSGSRTAAICMTGGFSAGSLVGGLLGQWGPLPLVLPYLSHVVLIIVAVFVVYSVPETLMRETGAGADRKRSNIFLPGKLTQALLVAPPLAICVYAFPATAINAVPVLIGMPGFPVAATGVLAGLTLGAGALVSPMQVRFGRMSGPVAAGCGVVGFALSALAATDLGFRGAVIPGALVLGAGGGLALSAGLARLKRVAAPGRLGTASAIFFGCAYLGFAVPFVLAALTPDVTIGTSLIILAGLCSLLAWQQARAKD
jgi:hypothetical protein